MLYKNKKVKDITSVNKFTRNLKKYLSLLGKYKIYLCKNSYRGKYYIKYKCDNCGFITYHNEKRFLDILKFKFFLVREEIKYNEKICEFCKER